MAYRDLETGRARDRERFRKRTAERRAKGLCPRCGLTPPAPGRSLCEICAGKRNAASRARDARLRAAGKPRRDPARALACERERTRRQTAERLALGVCTRCGKRPAAPERKNCEPCIEKRRAADRARYAAASADPIGPQTQTLMEEVLRRENLLKALKRVQSNKGAPGIDGMRVEELPDYLRTEWHAIREQLLEASYVPSPVREVCKAVTNRSWTAWTQKRITALRRPSRRASRCPLRNTAHISAPAARRKSAGITPSSKRYTRSAAAGRSSPGRPWWAFTSPLRCRPDRARRPGRRRASKGQAVEPRQRRGDHPGRSSGSSGAVCRSWGRSL